MTPFHIDHYHSACWQYKLKTEGYLDLQNIDCFCFPNEISIAEIIKTISQIEEPQFAIILTDYFGGAGKQCANVFYGQANADTKIKAINEALQHLGVAADRPLNEFDTLGFSKIRSQPEYLEKYAVLADEYGI